MKLHQTASVAKVRVSRKGSTPKADANLGHRRQVSVQKADANWGTVGQGNWLGLGTFGLGRAYLLAERCRDQRCAKKH
jgi:hypothetical protein